LFFLIGCETANGKIYKGTGLAGIQQCIVALGAQQALACMWEVDARLIIDQIKYLFNSWKPSQNPALVLQEIEINTIKKLQDDTYYKRPHPYIWGSFSLLQTKNMYN
jgi:CHAT domain-containing protein